jgi:3-hydroxybutyryl-CoA dehydrogenase
VRRRASEAWRPVPLADAHIEPRFDPDMTTISTVGVLGGGLMGSGIAQVAAQAGFATIVREVSEALGAKARSSIEKTLAKGIEKGKVTPEARDQALGRITTTTDVGALSRCDIVIEAVVEELEVKNALWRELDGIAPAHAVFASNTSSLTIAAMAAASGRADRMVGLHFFNPVPLMKLVEVVRTVTTSDATFAAAMDFARRLGKEPIEGKDVSGFVVNRLLVPYMLDAIVALERGVGTVRDIDLGMQLGAGHPMGPFTLLDFVGLDTTYRIAEIMFDEYREPRFAPPPLLKRMVMLGMYGRKSGRGFYDYSVEPPLPVELGI